MKRIFVWFALASIAVAAAAASCSINRRSGQYECEDIADCEQGRVCSEGLCVSPGGLDAPKPDAPTPDAPRACPVQCTSCTDSKVCVIDCTATGSNCGAQVVCPPGFNCEIRCNVAGSCRSGVICTNAASCTIQCTGRASCRNVQCGPGRCNLNCSGQDSCELVFCNQSCACDVRNCSFANGSCDSVTCTRPLCDTGLGCSSAVPGCNSCM